MASIIITGASDGIGKALALEFSRRGFNLGLLARRENLLQEVKAECLKSGAPSAFIAAVDVCDEKAFEAALTSLDESLSGADIFVANAGVGSRSSNKTDAWEIVKKTMQVNAMAAIHGIEFMKVKFVARGKGTLSGVSSVAGARGLPQSGSYSASKAALTTHLESLRLDLKAFGVSVVTIAPGFIATAMTAANKEQMPFLGTPEKSAKVFADALIAKKGWVVYPYPFIVLHLILQMMPRWFFDLVIPRMFARKR